MIWIGSGLAKCKWHISMGCAEVNRIKCIISWCFICTVLVLMEALISKKL